MTFTAVVVPVVLSVSEIAVMSVLVVLPTHAVVMGGVLLVQMLPNAPVPSAGREIPVPHVSQDMLDQTVLSVLEVTKIPAQTMDIAQLWTRPQCVHAFPKS